MIGLFYALSDYIPNNVEIKDESALSTVVGYAQSE
jgi:hypothetical protein